MMKRAAIVLAVGELVTACGDDTGPSGPPPPPVESQILILLSGDGQIAGTDGKLAAPLVARVQTQNGASVAGVGVSWTITAAPGSGARLIAPEKVSGGDGTASAGLRLGDTPGAYRVAAWITPSDSVHFRATAEERVAAGIVIASGDAQAGSVGQLLPAPLVVRVDDQFGDAVAGARVDFELSRGLSGSPSLSATIEVTDANGSAATSLTLGDKNGTYGVRAIAAGDTVGFIATASGGSQDLIGVSAVSPDPVTEGTVATIDGVGFSATPSENRVSFDGVPATVQSATTTQLSVLVPDFTALNRCLPRRSVTVQVVLGPDSAAPVSAGVVPRTPPLALAPGEDVVLAGPAGVDCVQLPAHPAGAEYELVASPVPTIGDVPLSLSVNGRSAVAPSVTQLPSPVAGGPAPGASIPAGPASSRQPQYELDGRLRALEHGLRNRIRARSAATFALRAVAAPPAIGDTVEFLNSCFSGRITAVVRSVGVNAAVLEDTVATGAFSPAQYDSIAANFDATIFPTDTTYFGAPGDVDGNGIVFLLFTAAVNALSPAYNVGIVTGFFCPIDIGGGNDAEMFYLAVPDPAGTLNGGRGPPNVLTPAVARRLADGTVAHEFQHMINAQLGGGGAADVWINEGLSHLAEEVVGHATTGLTPGSELDSNDLGADMTAFRQYYIGDFANLAAYLSAPTQAALLLTVDPGAPETFAMRGASWSFIRYLLDRFGTPSSEADLTRALVKSSAFSGKVAVSGVFGLPFEDLIADWNGMFSVEDRVDLGGTPRNELALTSYRLRDVFDVLMVGFGLGPYPLGPPDALLTRTLQMPSIANATVSPASGLFVRLSADTDTDGTAIRLSDQAGGDLSASNEPRLVIIRTK